MGCIETIRVVLSDSSANMPKFAELEIIDKLENTTSVSYHTDSRQSKTQTKTKNEKIKTNILMYFEIYRILR